MTQTRTINQTVTLAMAQHPATACKSFADYQQLTEQRVRDAVDQGANLLCFAEYASFELAAIWPGQTAKLQISHLQSLADQFATLYQQLARQYQVTIVAPSFLLQSDLGLVNRAWVFGPDSADYQDKIHPTRYEKQLQLASGQQLKLFDHQGINFAVVICYDSEFPTQSRALQQAGAELILVPSCTDLPAGFQRVQMSCRSRALENQLIVAQAPMAGSCDFSEVIDQNTGYAGVYAWPDIGLPDDGVLASGAASLNNGTASNWLVCEVSLKRIASVRRHGQVAVAEDWALPFHLG